MSSPSVTAAEISPPSSAPSQPPRPKFAKPTTRPRASFITRMRTMASIGLSMMFHSHLKLLGTLAGVVFAVILTNFGIGTFIGLLTKSVMLPNNSNADIWIVPLGAENLGPGSVNYSAVNIARTHPAVEKVAPLLYGGGSVNLPNGGKEAVTIVGAVEPYDLGGPWNFVVGDASVLRHPDTMLFENSYRSTWGGINLGTVREVSGRRTVVGGFTWGLTPFGPPLTYADYETAREYLHTPNDQTSFVLLKLKPGENSVKVAKELQTVLTDTTVFTTGDFKKMIYKNVLTKTPMGITFGAISMFGLVIGIVVVGLAMFSSVVDNLREFGTLKAVGATMIDLALLLGVQSVAYGSLGSIVGLFVVTNLARVMRSPKLAIELPPALGGATLMVMIGMCLFASMLALARLRKVEPGMVFR